MAKGTQGLREVQAKKLLEKWGLNSIEPHRSGALAVFGRQFTSPFSLVLIGAGVLTAFLKEVPDTIMIASFVLVNGLLGFFQEYRSERALRTLFHLSVSSVRVVRDGKEHAIPATHLVPGDLILLKEGDIIPADIRFVKTNNIQIDESILTGETLPVIKTAEGDGDTGFSQTSVISGTAQAVVTATGEHSRMGEIDRLALNTKHQSAFEQRLQFLGHATLRIVAVSLALLAAIHILFFPEDSIIDLLLFLIALAISAIPEALQLVTTFTLSTGSLRLAKRHVIVKRLSAIEDLGSIEVLCSDKTGTLTQNRMQCDAVYGDEEKTWLAAALGCTAHAGGFDGAIWKKIPKKLQNLVQEKKILKENPFDATRRSSSVLVELDNDKVFALRGAPEAVTEYCKTPKEECKALLAWASNQGKNGRRVLAFAKGNSERRCEFVGAIAFVDPMKPGVSNVVAEAKKLGITLKIISGDGPEVTGAVAMQSGIIDDPTNVITGAQIEKLSQKELHKVVQSASVFARISPEQKHRIIYALHENFTVGFLGEGVNDAPALRAAHIGIVVREACDIARAAADIILGEADLAVIIEGVKEGRRIFANTAKYIRATLTSNFGNFFAMIVASFFIPFLPMTAVQLLLVNLLSDFPMIAVVNDGIDKEEVEKPHGENFKGITKIAIALGLVNATFNLIFFFLFKNAGMAILQTNWFIGSVLIELFFLFSIRSARPLFLASAPSRILTTISFIAVVITILIPFSPLAPSLGFITPVIHDMGIIALLILAYIVTSELTKGMYLAYRRKKLSSRKLGWV